MSIVFNYGGGRQTVALCVLIKRGVLPLPDLFLMANTGRENPSTWAYLATYVQPMLATLGRQVTVIPCDTPPSLTYGDDDKPLIPVYSRDATGDGKMGPFCTGKWKRDKMKTWLFQNGYPKGDRWIGFSFNEQRRIARLRDSQARNPDGWTYRFPLDELMIETEGCLNIVRGHGFPTPPVSSCWMCPHKRNAEWAAIRDNHPDLWAQACAIDDEIREQDEFRGGLGMWLHHSRVPLRDADLTVVEPAETVRQCTLGECFN